MSYDHIKWEVRQCNSLCSSNCKELPPNVKKEFETDDRYTPETVKNCVKTTVNSLASVLDALDKGAEITSAGVRRFFGWMSPADLISSFGLLL